MAGKGFMDMKSMLKPNKKVPPPKEAPKKDEFGKLLFDQSFLEGRDKEIVFSTTFSKPDGKANWTYNKKPVKETDRVKIIFENENHSLKITNPKRSDAGKYQVEINGVISEATLTAEKEPTPPPASFLKKLNESYKGYKNRDILIECQIDPGQAKVQWIKGEKEKLKSGEKYEMSHDETTGICTLLIKNVDFVNADEYTIKVVGTTNESKTSLTVEEIPILFKKKLEGSVCIKEDNEVRFEVELNEENGEVNWFINGIPILEIVKDAKIIKDGCKRTILIKETPVIATGIVSCVSNSDKSECQLEVKARPKILKNLDDADLEAVEGEPLKMTVKAEGEISTAEWYIEDAKVENADRFKVVKSFTGGEFSLEINSLGMDDCNKEIYCKLDDMKSRVFKINVEKREGKPEIKMGKNENISLKPVQNSAQFSVPYLIEGKRLSELEVNLFKDGKLFICETTIEEDKVLFKISKASRKTSGRYEVELKNAEGSAKTEFIINLQEVPSPPTDVKVTDITETGCVVSWKPPSDDGGSRLTHYYLEKLQVVKEGEKKDWGIYEEVSGKNFSCIVEGLIPKTEYKFRVKACNAFGESEAALYGGTVFPKDPYGPGQNSPVFLIRPTSQLGYRGETLAFSCRIRAIPTALVTWFKDEMELTDPRKYNKCLQENGDYLFTIKDLSGEDRGKYVFRAENRLGRSESFAMLTFQKVEATDPGANWGIYKTKTDEYKFRRSNFRFKACKEDGIIWNISGLEKDSSPVFTFPLRNRVVQFGEMKCKLLCCLAGKPAPRVTWFKDSEALNPHYFNFVQADNVVSIEIQNCSWNDSGVYKCVAENNLGRVTTQCYVTVE